MPQTMYRDNRDLGLVAVPFQNIQLHESAAHDLRGLVGVTSLEGLRILNRYDVENIGAELFEACKKTVFSEPQIDKVSSKIDADGAYVFAVEYLPGQFDQRADSAAQCIQILSEGDRPTVRTAKLYLLSGALSDEDKAKIKKYVINPVECREASLELPETLTPDYRIPDSVEVLEGFTELDDAGLLAGGAILICEDERLGLADDVMVEARYQKIKDARYGRVSITYLAPLAQGGE